MPFSTRVLRSAFPPTSATLLLSVTLLSFAAPARAQQAINSRSGASRSPAPRRAEEQVASPEASLGAEVQQEPRVTITGAAINQHDDIPPKLNHIMREVSGTQITVTKKASVIKPDHQPPVQNNNLQELFTRAPGLLIAEQSNPGQFNYSYRGLGNPQESEYTLFLQDGLPLMAEWIGFPTLFYQPFPQSVSEIQLIRGGSSLLYGPEPAPAVNFVMKRPAPGTPVGGYVEASGGAYGYFSGYGAAQQATGPWEFRVNGG